MAQKKGLSAKCINSIMAYAESAADYESRIHRCKDHKDKKSCTYAKRISEKATQPLIDNLFRYCRL